MNHWKKFAKKYKMSFRLDGSFFHFMLFYLLLITHNFSCFSISETTAWVLTMHRIQALQLLGKSSLLTFITTHHCITAVLATVIHLMTFCRKSSYHNATAVRGKRCSQFSIISLLNDQSGWDCKVDCQVEVSAIDKFCHDYTHDRKFCYELLTHAAFWYQCT